MHVTKLCYLDKLLDLALHLHSTSTACPGCCPVAALLYLVHCSMLMWVLSLRAVRVKLSYFPS